MFFGWTEKMERTKISLFKILVFVNKVLIGFRFFRQALQLSLRHRIFHYVIRESLDIFTFHFVPTSDKRLFFGTRIWETVKLNDWQTELQRSKLFWNICEQFFDILRTQKFHAFHFFGPSSRLFVMIWTNLCWK